VAAKLLEGAKLNDEAGWRYSPHRSDADISVTIMQVMALRAAKNAGFNVQQGDGKRDLLSRKMLQRQNRRLQLPIPRRRH
jgi:hypothetical protein